MIFVKDKKLGNEDDYWNLSGWKKNDERLEQPINECEVNKEKAFVIAHCTVQIESWKLQTKMKPWIELILKKICKFKLVSSRIGDFILMNQQKVRVLKRRKSLQCE